MSALVCRQCAKRRAVGWRVRWEWYGNHGWCKQDSAVIASRPDADRLVRGLRARYDDDIRNVRLMRVYRKAAR